MDLVKALWRGDLPLWKTYWLFGVLGGLTFTLAFNYIAFTSLTFYDAPGANMVFGVIVTLFVLYTVWVLVGIWRSSGKYTGPLRYSVLARIVCAAAWVRLGLSLLGLSGLALQFTITPQSLREEAAALNAQLPTQIDEYLRLDRVSADGLQLTYDYTFVQVASIEADPDGLLEFMSQMKSEICKGMQDYLAVDVVIFHRYQGNDGVPVDSQLMNSTTCAEQTE